MWAPGRNSGLPVGSTSFGTRVKFNTLRGFADHSGTSRDDHRAPKTTVAACHQAAACARWPGRVGWLRPPAPVRRRARLALLRDCLQRQREPESATDHGGLRLFGEYGGI